MDNQYTPPNGNINAYNFNHNPNNFFTNPVIDTLAGWMKFIGIFTVVMGAITCLGILSAAIGVPMILSGISLYKASINLKIYKDHSNPITLNVFFSYLNKYFKTQGIFIIIAIVLFILYIAAFFVMVVIVSMYTIQD